MLDLDFIKKNKKNVSDFLKEEYYVYFLLKEDEIVYIGKTINFQQRLKSHMKTKDFDGYYLYKCRNEKEMDVMEFDLIVKFQPMYNMTLPPSDYFFSVNKLKEKLNLGAWDFKRYVKSNKLKPICNLSGNLYFDIRDFEVNLNE